MILLCLKQANPFQNDCGFDVNIEELVTDSQLESNDKEKRPPEEF